MGRTTMVRNNLGVRSDDECASLQTDHQNDMFVAIRSGAGADLVELNIRLQAKTAPKVTDLVSASEAEKTAAVYTAATDGR
jgi:hypothetical protein